MDFTRPGSIEYAAATLLAMAFVWSFYRLVTWAEVRLGKSTGGK